MTFKMGVFTWFKVKCLTYPHQQPLLRGRKRNPQVNKYIIPTTCAEAHLTDVHKIWWGGRGIVVMLLPCRKSNPDYSFKIVLNISSLLLPLPYSILPCFALCHSTFICLLFFSISTFQMLQSLFSFWFTFRG